MGDYYIIGVSERAEEGDRISPLKGNGQALEQKHCLPGVLGDTCDPPANFLNQLNSHLVPCPSNLLFYAHQHKASIGDLLQDVIDDCVFVSYCQVMTSSLSVQVVSYEEDSNIWIGPRLVSFEQ